MHPTALQYGGALPMPTDRWMDLGWLHVLQAIKSSGVLTLIPRSYATFYKKYIVFIGSRNNEITKYSLHTRKVQKYAIEKFNILGFIPLIQPKHISFAV